MPETPQHPNPANTADPSRQQAASARLGLRPPSRRGGRGPLSILFRPPTPRSEWERTPQRTAGGVALVCTGVVVFAVWLATWGPHPPSLSSSGHHDPGSRAAQTSR